MYELLHTLLVVQKMHRFSEIALLWRAANNGQQGKSPSSEAGARLGFDGSNKNGPPEAQAIFCRRRHQPRRPPISPSIIGGAEAPAPANHSPC